MFFLLSRCAQRAVRETSVTYQCRGTEQTPSSPFLLLSAAQLDDHEATCWFIPLSSLTSSFQVLFEKKNHVRFIYSRCTQGTRWTWPLVNFDMRQYELFPLKLQVRLLIGFTRLEKTWPLHEIIHQDIGCVQSPIQQQHLVTLMCHCHTDVKYIVIARGNNSDKTTNSSFLFCSKHSLCVSKGWGNRGGYGNG